MYKSLERSWSFELENEFSKPYFQKLSDLIESEYKTKIIYPSKNDLLNAFNHCTFNNIKVVIIGQDPYHGPNQAHGLAFSVPQSIKIPPSLRNILKELKDDVSVDKTSGDLTNWAEQGVLLLNTILTVQAGKPASHANIGWEQFTDAVIQKISDHKQNIVFIAWGKSAQSKVKFIDTNKHLVLKAPHPSPLSSHRGFFGSKPFSKTNKYLLASGIPPINW